MPAKRRNLYEVAENDRVQTGPGLPTWTWKAVYFSSSGPLPQGQTLSVIYSSPIITSLWRVLSVFLVAAIAGLVLLQLARQLKNKPDNATPPESDTPKEEGGGFCNIYSA